MSLAGLALQAAAVGLACSFLVVAVVSAVRPTLDEPLALRWLRTWAEHPLRCACAVGLLAAALRAPSGAPAS